MPAHPFTTCTLGIATAQALVGTSLARGFRRKVDEAMGGDRGCTHLRDPKFYRKP